MDHRADHLDNAADRLDSAADQLGAAGRGLSALDGSAAALDGDGGPGQLGRALHERWREVLAARSREAADAADRLTDAAQAVRVTAQRYAEADDLTARRLRRPM